VSHGGLTGVSQATSHVQQRIRKVSPEMDLGQFSQLAAEIKRVVISPKFKARAEAHLDLMLTRILSSVLVAGRNGSLDVVPYVSRPRLSLALYMCLAVVLLSERDRPSPA
jgi:hypothetical protein